MAISVSTTRTDADHIVTYTVGGAPVTGPRELPLVVYAPNAPGTYPIIAYSHGHGGGPTQAVAANASALADLGYIVIAPAHLDGFFYSEEIQQQFQLTSPATSLHRVADLQFAIDEAATLAGLLPGGYTADLTRIVAAGHSHGAHTAALLAGLDPSAPEYSLSLPNDYGLASTSDARIDAAILLSPQGLDSGWATLDAASWNALAVPVLGLTGTQDDTPGGIWASRLDFLRHADSGPLYAAVFQGAAHNEIGGREAPPGLTAAIASISDTFLDAVLLNDAGAIAAMASPQGLVNAYPMLQSAYERAGAGFGGSANGSAYARGGAAVDALFGLQTDDLLIGAGGDDLIYAGGGADVIDGGEGVDTVSYADVSAPVAINLGAAASSWSGPAFNDSFVNVEVVAGTPFADVLIGAGAMALNGAGGNDLLYGDAFGTAFLMRRMSVA